MKLYKQIRIKDRLPDFNKRVIVGWDKYPEDSIVAHLSDESQYWSLSGSAGPAECDEPDWWLEEIDLGDLKFTKEDSSPEFVDGINYILDKLK